MIVSLLAFNAYADLQNVGRDLVKPINTKSTESQTVSASGATVDKDDAVKVKANKVTKSKKREKAKSDKQTEILTLLKNNQTCGSWFDASGSTGDAAAYEQIKASGYTKSNAPAAVKKQIAIGVTNCDKKYLVEKPINTTEAKSTSEAGNIQQTGKIGEVDQKVKSEKGFFAKLFDGIKNVGRSNHDCSPGERVMHSDGC